MGTKAAYNIATVEKVGEGGRRLEKVGEGWRRLEKVGGGSRRLEKVGEGWRRFCCYNNDEFAILSNK